MRIKAFTIAVPLLATTALAGGWAQSLPAPACHPPVAGGKDVVTTHEISLDVAKKDWARRHQCLPQNGLS